MHWFAVLLLFMLFVGLTAPAAWAKPQFSEGMQSKIGAPQPPPMLTGEPDPLPDLQTQPPFDLIIIEISSTGRRLLRFSNSIANNGLIDLTLTGEFDHVHNAYRVAQNLPVGNGEFAYVDLDQGYIHYHPEHYHWHLDRFARYEIWTAAVGGELRELLRTNGKVSYCIMDTDRLPGETDPSEYHSCGPSLQGLSVGWADTYMYHLPGQWVDISGLPDGFYALRSVVDPHNFIHEIDDHNNDVVLTFYLHDGRLENLHEVPADWSHTRPQPD